MELNEQLIPLRVDARPLSNLGRSFSAWEPGSGSASSEFLNDVSEGAFVTITGDQKWKDETQLLRDPREPEWSGERRGGGLGLTRRLKVRAESASPRGRWSWLRVRSVERGVDGNSFHSRAH